MFYVTGEHYTYMQDDALSWFFLICIVLPNVVFIVYWVICMRLAVLKMIHKKNLNRNLFMVVAFSKPEVFYEVHMKEEEELALKNAVKVVPDDKLQDEIETEKNAVTVAQLLGKKKGKTNKKDGKKKKKKDASQIEQNFDGGATARSMKVHPEPTEKEGQDTVNVD